MTRIWIVIALTVMLGTALHVAIRRVAVTPRRPQLRDPVHSAGPASRPAVRHLGFRPAQQDPKPVGPEQSAPLPNQRTAAYEGLHTLDELIQDKPVKPLEMTANAIEQGLKETGAIKFSFESGPLIFPAVSPKDQNGVATAIMQELETRPHDTVKVHAGRTAVILSSGERSGRSVAMCVFPALRAMYGALKGQNPPSISAAELAAQPLAADEQSITACLNRIERISVQLGSSHFVMPLTDKSPRTQLARAILPLIQQQSVRKMRLLDADKTLYIASTGANGDWCVGLLVSPLIDDSATPEPSGAHGADKAHDRTTNDPFAADTKEKAERSLKTYPLQHSRAADIATILQQLFRDERVSIAADMRTNSVVVSGPDNLQSAIEALARKLDEAPAKVTSPVPNVNHATSPTAGSKPVTESPQKLTAASMIQPPWYANIAEARAAARRLNRPLLLHFRAAWCDVCRKMKTEVLNTPEMQRALRDRVVGVQIDIDQHPDLAEEFKIDGIPAWLFVSPSGKAISTTVGFTTFQNLMAKIAHAESATAESFQEQYHSSEQKAAELARQLREAGGSDVALKAKLREAVAKAFEARQQLHQSELASFKERMAKIQQTIRSREIIKEEIIDRRVEDLLNPDFKWEATHESKTPAAKPRVAAQPLSNPPELGSGNRVSELQGEWYLESIKGAGIRSYEEGLRCRIHGTKWAMVRGIHLVPYEITLNPELEPKTIDMTVKRTDGMPAITSKGIYRLEGDNLIVAWGTDETVRPTGFDDPNAGIHTWGRVQEQDKAIQFEFTGPVGAKLTRLEADTGSNGVKIRDYTLPVRIPLAAGTRQRFKFSQFPDDPHWEQVISIEVPFVSTGSRDFVRQHAIPVQITETERDWTYNGTSFKKAIYLTNANQPGAKPAIAELVTNASISPSTDVDKEARRLGTLVAVIHSLQGTITFPGTSTSHVIGPQLIDQEPPSLPITLKEAVDKFRTNTANDTFQIAIPLTEDEVVAAIRWVLLPTNPRPLHGVERRVLQRIADERLLPGGWSINVRSDVAIPATLPPMVQYLNAMEGVETFVTGAGEFPRPLSAGASHTGAFRQWIVLSYAPAGTGMNRGYVIRSTPFFAPSNLDQGEPKAASLDPKSISLLTAIEEFNQAHHTIAGEKQPPLTEGEVVAALRDWKSRRRELAISDAEFVVFQEIAERRQLPPGATLEVLETFQPDDKSTFDIWSIRIKIPKADPAQGTVALIIRERFIRSTVGNGSR